MFSRSVGLEHPTQLRHRPFIHSFRRQRSISPNDLRQQTHKKQTQDASILQQVILHQHFTYRSTRPSTLHHHGNCDEQHCHSTVIIIRCHHWCLQQRSIDIDRQAIPIDRVPKLCPVQKQQVGGRKGASHLRFQVCPRSRQQQQQLHHQWQHQ